MGNVLLVTMSLSLSDVGGESVGSCVGIGTSYQVQGIVCRVRLVVRLS